MSLLSQILGLSASGIPISGTLQWPFLDVKFNTPGGQTYMASGFIGAAASYPTAATVDQIKIVGAPITLPLTPNNPPAGNSSNPIRGVAVNGNNVVMCTGDTTNVMVSTNGGGSFNSVAHNLIGPSSSAVAALDVVYTGTQWILFGVSTNGSYLVSSYTSGASPSSFTLGAQLTNTGQMDTDCKAAYNGSCTVVAASQTNTSGTMTAVFTAPATAYWSGAIAGSSTYFHPWTRPAYDGTAWVIVNTNNGTVLYNSNAVPPNNTTAWSNGTLSGDGVFTKVISSTLYMLSTTGWYTSTNHGVTWTSYTPVFNGAMLPGTTVTPSQTPVSSGFNCADAGTGTFLGWSGYCPDGMFYSTDLINWSYRQINNLVNSSSPPSVVVSGVHTIWGAIPITNNGALIVWNTTSARYSSNIQTADYVGLNRAVYPGSTTPDQITYPTSTLYVRLQ